AARTQNEDLFARLKFRAGNEHVPSRLKHERNGGGLLERKVFRIGQAVYFGRTNQLRATTVDHVAEVGELAAAGVQSAHARGPPPAGHARSEDDFLTDADAGDFGAHSGNFAGDVTAGDVWERNRNVG